MSGTGAKAPIHNTSFAGNYKPGTAGPGGVHPFGFVDVQQPVIPDAMQRIKMK